MGDVVDWNLHFFLIFHCSLWKFELSWKGQRNTVHCIASPQKLSLRNQNPLCIGPIFRKKWEKKWISFSILDFTLKDFLMPKQETYGIVQWVLWIPSFSNRFQCQVMQFLRYHIILQSENTVFNEKTTKISALFQSVNFIKIRNIDNELGERYLLLSKVRIHSNSFSDI